MSAQTNARQLHFWTHPGYMLWYCYGTFIGESVTRETSSGGAWAIRYVIPKQTRGNIL